MKRALIIGATGLIGKELVNELVANDLFEDVIVLSRRSLNFSHPKLKEVIINFDKIDQVKIDQPIDVCFCAMGTTQNKSGKSGMTKVDFEYVVQIAQWCINHYVPIFSVVSSQMANEHSRNFYLKTKGQMEEALKKLPFKSLQIFRPSLLTGQREEFRLGERLGYFIYKIFQPIMIGKLRKLRTVSGLQVALCMVHHALISQQGNFTIESDVIQDY